MPAPEDPLRSLDGPLGPRRLCRVREAVAHYGITKGWVFNELRAGRLRGKKLGGVLLIDLQQLEERIASAPDWTPRGAAK